MLREAKRRVFELKSRPANLGTLELEPIEQGPTLAPAESSTGGASTTSTPAAETVPLFEHLAEASEVIEIEWGYLLHMHSTRADMQRLPSPRFQDGDARAIRQVCLLPNPS